MPDKPVGWKFVRFLEVLDRWGTIETPSVDLRIIVADWTTEQMVNPYRGMRREPGFDNLWFGPIPGTRAGWSVVTCSYFVFERERIVRCNDICTLENVP